MPTTEKPRVLGGTWTDKERPCAECGEPHRHLTDLSDGRAMCITCAWPFFTRRGPQPTGGQER